MKLFNSIQFVLCSLFFLVLLAGCTPVAPQELPQQQPTQVSIPNPTFTPIAPPLAPATPELLWVDPVTSPTDQLTQVIVVYIGNGEEVTVVTESGTFSVTGEFSAYSNPARVEIELIPNTEHHLEVFAKVREIPAGQNQHYGGYTLSTTVDKNFQPLTIVQVSP